MIYSFSNFALDTDKAELRQNGAPVRVEPQVFDLLHLLVSSDGRMISRDEVFSAIWGDRVVSDAALSSRIRDARKALGDSGAAQQFIKTVHRRGLQFVAEVSSDMPRTSRLPKTLPDLKGKPSIGVLPFRTFGSSDEDLFLASGLTEDIAANLTRFRGLIVFSRTTTAAVKDSANPVAELHQRHGANLILQGSLQRTESRLRVRIQMVDAASEAILLSEQFDRPFSSALQFDIQDEIASLVAARVGGLYGPTGQMLDTIDRKGRAKSWETVYWLARFHRYTDMRDPTNLAEITAGLQAALAEDPDSSDGWAALARMRVEEYRLPFHYPPKRSLLDDALEFASKAVRLDAANDFALTALALVDFHNYETDEFEIAAEQAIASNPNSAFTLAEIALCYCLQNDFDRAMPLARRAIELSPVHPGWFRMPIACGLFMQGKVREALVEQLKTPVLGYFWYHAHIAAYYAELGQLEQAAAEVEAVRQLYPHFEERVHSEGYVLCTAKPFFDRMADAWRKAGFRLPDAPYDSGYG